MSKTKRNDKGQYTKNRAMKRLAMSWVATLASLGLLYGAGGAVLATFGSFRSCDANNTGLFIRNCGKESLNVGDVIIIGLFITSAALVASVFTASLRMTRKGI